MSNHLKHIAVKNDYYSGKMFDSASTQYLSEQAAYEKSGIIFKMSTYIAKPLARGNFVNKIKSIWKRNSLQRSI